MAAACTEYEQRDAHTLEAAVLDRTSTHARIQAHTHTRAYDIRALRTQIRAPGQPVQRQRSGRIIAVLHKAEASPHAPNMKRHI